MIRHALRFLSLCSLMLCGLLISGTAHAVELQGALEQGGLVIGHAKPDDRITLDGTPVAVDPTGLFVIGFGRDAAAKAELKITSKVKGGDDITRIHALTIKPRKWIEQRINGLPKKQVTPPYEVYDHIKRDSAAIRKVRAAIRPNALFNDGFIIPTEGRISSPFGAQRILNGKPRAPHSGQDIAAPTGTVVRAAADGIVSLVDRNMYYTGKTMMIDHGIGLQTVYAHMSQILVKPGESVRRGQIIGRVGATGRATGPHLHWGVSWRDRRLDPATVLKVWPASAG